MGNKGETTIGTDIDKRNLYNLKEDYKHFKSVAKNPATSENDKEWAYNSLFKLQAKIKRTEARYNRKHKEQFNDN